MADASVNVKPCIKCGATERGNQGKGNCKVCERRRSRKSYLENKEFRLKRGAEWKKANRERVAALNAAWAADNPEKIAGYRQKHKEKTALRVAEWQKKNYAKVLKNVRAYYAANKEKCAAATRKWNLSHPEEKRKYSNDRRSRERYGSTRGLSKGIAEKLVLLQRGKCACCGVELKSTKYHLDHIMPLSRGGKHEDSNIQLLCRSCNLRKHAKHPITFMQERGFLL